MSAQKEKLNGISTSAGLRLDARTFGMFATKLLGHRLGWSAKIHRNLLGKWGFRVLHLGFNHGNGFPGTVTHAPANVAFINFVFD